MLTIDSYESVLYFWDWPQHELKFLLANYLPWLSRNILSEENEDSAAPPTRSENQGLLPLCCAHFLCVLFLYIFNNI